jgi:chromosome segregation ATPase
MQYYEEHEPGERTNELHSILGTEVYPLGDDLERHYQEYFEDRSVVVSFHMGYQAVFSRLEAQATQLKGEIDMLAKSLNVDIANYNSSMEQLNLLTRRHNDQLTRINRTDRASVSSYNTESDRLRREQRSLADTKKEIDQRYAAYNDKIEAYNRIAVRSETLTNSIDSMKAPVEAAR